jgi:hypothetical protein
MYTEEGGFSGWGTTKKKKKKKDLQTDIVDLEGVGVSRGGYRTGIIRESVQRRVDLFAGIGQKRIAS